MVADDSVVQPRGRADVADRHVAGADADAQGQDLLRLHEPGLLQRRQRAAHLQRHPHGAHGVVLVRHRVAEENLDLLADVLVQRAAILEHDLRHRVQVGVQQVDQLFGLVALGDRREPPHVHEGYREVLPPRRQRHRQVAGHDRIGELGRQVALQRGDLLQLG